MKKRYKKKADRKEENLYVRMTKREKRLLRERAKAKARALGLPDMTVSTYIRHLIMRDVEARDKTS